MENRKSFVMFLDWHKNISKMKQEEKGLLLDLMYAAYSGNPLPEIPEEFWVLDIFWDGVEGLIARQIRDYNSAAKRREGNQSSNHTASHTGSPTGLHTGKSQSTDTVTVTETATGKGKATANVKVTEPVTEEVPIGNVLKMKLIAADSNLNKKAEAYISSVDELEF